MSGTRAAILIRDGALPHQQESACLDYCHRHRYTVTTICRESADAAIVAEVGAVDVVVAAFASADDRTLEDRVVDAGGRLEYVRKPKVTARVDLGCVVAGMHRRGAAVADIAHLLEMDTVEVRGHLRQRGVRIR